MTNAEMDNFYSKVFDAHSEFWQTPTLVLIPGLTESSQLYQNDYDEAVARMRKQINKSQREKCKPGWDPVSMS